MDAPRPGPDARRAIPTGLIGMIALVLAIEALVIGGDDRFRNDVAVNWAYKGRAATREATACDILCLGDSLVEFGVIPRVIESRAGGRCYNLAMHAGPPAASYVLLRRALAAGARPRALVLDAMPHQLAMGPDRPDFRRGWAEMADPGECLDLAWTTRNAGFFASLMLSKALPSYRSRHEVRANLLAAFEGRGLSPRNLIRLFRRNWDQNSGAQIMPDDFHPLGPTAPSDQAPLATRWACDPATLAYVHRLLNLAESRGIAVYWLVPPVSPSAEDERRRSGIDAPYDRLLAQLRSRYPHLTILDGRGAGYDNSVFADSIHLDRRGASTLSADIGDVLAQRTRFGSGLVTLPRFREREIDVPLEDMDGSLLAIREHRGRAKR